MFSERFDFSLPARISFVGGGGKTSLILKLLEEYSESLPAIYTTTTRIHPPHPADGMVVLSSDNAYYLETLLERAVHAWSRGRKFVVTRLPISRDLLRGVDPGFGDRLDKKLFPLVLNEADGARSMSLKMPRQGEPVLLAGTNYLVPTIGLDCLNQPLGPATLFRWEMASKRHHLTPGSILTPELAAAILLHPQGVCKDWQSGMKIVAFVNKADSSASDAEARALAIAILRNGNFPVERVVFGSVQHSRAEAVVG